MSYNKEITVLGNSIVRYEDHLGDDQKIANTARISYRGESQGLEEDVKLLGYLYRNKHTSPFELASITFHIKMPIFTMRQFVRHRTFRLNETSARYKKLDIGWYLPKTWRVQAVKNKQSSDETDTLDHHSITAEVNEHNEACFAKYESLLERGVAREMARMVLPLNSMTEIIVNIDLNNLIKYFILRDDAHAQSEIVDISRAMKEITADIFPEVMGLYERMLKKNNDTAAFMAMPDIKKMFKHFVDGTEPGGLG